MPAVPPLSRGHAVCEGLSMSDTTACPYCGFDYGHGPDDCPLCRSVRRKDLILRWVIGLMFLVPILTLLTAILLDGGTGMKLFTLD